MSYDKETDTFTCVNGEKLFFAYKTESKTKNGYVVEHRRYRTMSCTQCVYKDKCYKSKKKL